MTRSLSSAVFASALVHLTLVFPASGQDKLLSETYSLAVTFEGQHAQASFFHDVHIDVKKKGRLVLRVVPDVSSAHKSLEANRSETNDDQKASALGGGENTLWKVRPADQKAWFPNGTRFYGQIDAEQIDAEQIDAGQIDAGQIIRFGLTEIRKGRMVSLHFVGEPTETGAKGKVYCLSTDASTFEGRWELHNPQPRSLPIGPSIKGITVGIGSSF